jgi:hypothetical protein
MPGEVAAADSEAVQFHVYCAHFEVSVGVYDPQLNPPLESRRAVAVSAGEPEADFAQKES